MSHKEVQIRRKEQQSSHLPAEVIQEARRSIGSVYDNRSPLRGLSSQEERELLPLIIGVDAESKDFTREARYFWADLTLDVPASGVVLQIGKDESGNPYNIEDYVTYMWCKKHPQVAESKEAMIGHPTKEYYIYDLDRETSKENKDIKIKRDAYKEFIRVSAKEETMDHMIRVMGNQRPATLSLEQKENVLDRLLNEDPKAFLRAAKNKDLSIESSILRMIELGVLRRIGNQILFMDETIGDTMEEAVAYVKNPKNSSTVTTIKARLKEQEKVAV